MKYLILLPFLLLGCLRPSKEEIEAVTLDIKYHTDMCSQIGNTLKASNIEYIKENDDWICLIHGVPNHPPPYFFKHEIRPIIRYLNTKDWRSRLMEK